MYANLGLVTLWTALGKPPTIVKTSAGGTESILLGQTTIPLDKKGRLCLHYRGKKQTFPYYSAADILSGTINQVELQGKIILVGTSAVGLHDLRTTPLDDGFPGVEAHATLIDNILSGDFIQVPDWLPGLHRSEQRSGAPGQGAGASGAAGDARWGVTCVPSCVGRPDVARSPCRDRFRRARACGTIYVDAASARRCLAR